MFLHLKSFSFLVWNKYIYFSIEFKFQLLFEGWPLSVMYNSGSPGNPPVTLFWYIIYSVSCFSEWKWEEEHGSLTSLKWIVHWHFASVWSQPNHTLKALCPLNQLFTQNVQLAQFCWYWNSFQPIQHTPRWQIVILILPLQ